MPNKQKLVAARGRANLYEMRAMRQRSKLPSWTSFSVGRQRKWRLPVVPVELEEWKFILVESVLHDKGAVQLAGAVYSLNDTRKVRSP